MSDSLKLFFIVNQKSGSHQLDLVDIIDHHYQGTLHMIEKYILSASCQPEELKSHINNFAPDRVIAVGGDGTVRLASQILLNTNTPLAIVPAGSANGMAKEIGLKNNIEKALEIAVTGIAKPIHALMINNELSIHLADAGLNARIIKKFQSIPQRGMVGYAKAMWHALSKHKRMHVSIHSAGKLKQQKAEMVVIANGTMYGTGVKINRDGSLFDDHFEVIVVKWFSFVELLKMYFSFKTSFDPFKTEIIKTDHVTIETKERTLFQIDGEYIGKVNHIEAKIILNAIWLVIPDVK